MSQALFDELEVTSDVFLIWSGHQQLGAHWRTWERVEISPQDAVCHRRRDRKLGLDEY